MTTRTDPALVGSPDTYLRLRFDAYGNGRTILVTVPATFDLDDNLDRVFHAANRIEDLPTDINRLRDAWQRVIRGELDLCELPSMSVGDLVELVGPGGHILAASRCAHIGWETVTLAESPDRFCLASHPTETGIRCGRPAGHDGVHDRYGLTPTGNVLYTWDADAQTTTRT